MYVLFYVCVLFFSAVFLGFVGWVFKESDQRNLWLAGALCLVVLINFPEISSRIDWELNVCPKSGMRVYGTESVSGFYIKEEDEKLAKLLADSALLKAGYNFVEIDNGQGSGYIRFENRNGVIDAIYSEDLMSKFVQVSREVKRNDYEGTIRVVKDIKTGAVLGEQEIYYYYGGDGFRYFLSKVNHRLMNSVAVCPKVLPKSLLLQVIPSVNRKKR